MKKVEQVRFWLDQDVLPKEIARRVPCALSLVYTVKRLAGMASLRHEIGALKEELQEIQERVSRLEGGPPDIVQRVLSRNSSQ